MIHDDWDSVSHDTPPNSATDPWDVVSAPQRPPAPAQRRLPPDNLVIEGDAFQSTHLSGQIMPVMESFRESQPDTSALPFPARSESIAISTSTDTFALPPISPPLRYKQIIRDVLALLSTVLFWVFAPYLWHHFFIYFLGSLHTPLLCVLSYAIGIFIAAVSGRKGFDVLFPVLSGCITGFVIVILFITWMDFYLLVFDLYIFILPLLGAATYVVIQKIRSRSTRRRVNK
jgi:hypothetical protein